MSTKERLAQKLHSLGLLELERRARQGEFSDFEGPHATPKVVLVQELTGITNAAELRQQVMDGEYDDTKEEAEAWFQREGKSLL